jgi:hypothetical protein
MNGLILKYNGNSILRSDNGITTDRLYSIWGTAEGEVFAVGYNGTILRRPVESQPPNQPPIAKCNNVTILAGASCTASASIDNGSYDPDGDSITLTQLPPGPYSLGNTSVTLTVVDTNDASSQCTGTVTVVDNTPPTITGISMNPSVLWPPNHKMVPVSASVSASDNCDPKPTVSLTSINMNEGDKINTYDPNYDTTTAVGWVGGDIQVDGNGNIYLRAERSGTGSGRIYTITFTATDASGNSSSATSAIVTVPHNL